MYSDPFFRLDIQEVLLQKLGPEVLRRCQTIRTAFGRKVHQVPVGPDGVHMISLQLSPPKMEDPGVVFSKHMQDGPLHVVIFALASVVSLVGGAKA